MMKIKQIRADVIDDVKTEQRDKIVQRKSFRSLREKQEDIHHCRTINNTTDDSQERRRRKEERRRWREGGAEGSSIGGSVCVSGPGPVDSSAGYRCTLAPLHLPPHLARLAACHSGIVSAVESLFNLSVSAGSERAASGHPFSAVIRGRTLGSFF